MLILKPDDFLILFSSSLAIVLVIGQLVRSVSFRSIFLSCILLILSYILFVSYLFQTKTIYSYPHLLYTQRPLAALLGPLFIFYGLSFMHDRYRFSAWDLVHIIPALVLFAVALPKMLLPAWSKTLVLDSIYNRERSLFWIINNSAAFIFIAYMTFLVIQIRDQYDKNNIVHKRLRNILLLILSCIILAVAKPITKKLGLWHITRLITILYSLEIIFLFIACQKYPFLFSSATMGSSKTSRTRTYLGNIDIENLRQNTEALMEKDKLYCDDNLSLETLAKALELTAHQLSEFLNVHYGKNFSSFINCYRIRHACGLLQNNPDASTISVAFASGFNSYSSFFKAFRRETGKSPNEYRAEFEKNMSASSILS